MTPISTGFLDIDNGTLLYEMAGSGPDIVLIHAFSFDHREWDLQFEALAKTHRVVRYDLRGFGRSSLPTEQYDHGDDLAQLMHHLNLVRPLLVGVSLGSNIALNFAARNPDQIFGAILSSPGLPGHVWKEKRPPETAKEFAAEHGVEAGKKNWLAGPVFSSLSKYPEALAAVKIILDDYSGWHWMHDDMQIPQKPIMDILETINVPMLILSGDLDVDGYREIATLLFQRLPNAKLHRFKNAGHMHNMEIADEFTARIVEFASNLH